MKKYCMIGIDCDPDRNSKWPRYTWTGFNSVREILDYGPFALNVRMDEEIAGLYCNDPMWCFNNPVVDEAKLAGCSVGVHFHPTGRDGCKRNGHTKVLLGTPDEFKISIHDGWLNHESLNDEAAAGFKLNYSPAPGSHGPYYDWRDWPNRPVWHKGMLILPTQTIKTWISRTYNGIATVYPTAPHWHYRRLVKAFEKTGNDTLVTTFHADELNGAIGGLRARVYSKKNLIRNIRYLKERGYIFQNANEVYERYNNTRCSQPDS